MFVPELSSLWFGYGVAGVAITISLYWDDAKCTAASLLGIAERSESDQIVDTVNINTEPDAPWQSSNDTLVEALRLSQTHPSDGIRRIREIVKSGININARNGEGRTIMDIARYRECSPMILSVLEQCGSKVRRT
jgi:hypothetical protein